MSRSRSRSETGRRTLIALLRGVNVGRAKRIAMADLRGLVADLGFGDVRTVLASGNVIFTDHSGARPAATAARLEDAIEDRFGLTTRIVLLASPELDEIVAGNPLLDIADNPSRLLVACLADRGKRARLEPLADGDWDAEMIALGRRVAYLWCPEGVLASRLPKAVEAAVDGAVTSRSWATILKIHARV